MFTIIPVGSMQNKYFTEQCLMQSINFMRNAGYDKVNTYEEIFSKCNVCQ
jgi:hypothetical protein